MSIKRAAQRLVDRAFGTAFERALRKVRRHPDRLVLLTWNHRSLKRPAQDSQMRSVGIAEGIAGRLFNGSRLFGERVVSLSRRWRCCCPIHCS